MGISDFESRLRTAKLWIEELRESSSPPEGLMESLSALTDLIDGAISKAGHGESFTDTPSSRSIGLPQCSIITDLSGSILGFDGSAPLILLTSKESLKKNNIADLFTDKEAAASLLNRVKKGEGPSCAKVVLVGDGVPVECEAALDGGESLIRWAVRIGAAEVRSGLEMQYKTIVENSMECICQISLDGKILYVNPAGLKLNEMERQEDVIGKDASSAVLPDYRALMEEAFRAAREGKSTNLEYRSATKSGAVRWWESVVVPIIGGNGAVSGIIRISKDVSRRKSSEESMKDTLWLFQSVMDNTKAAIFIRDTEGRYIMANRTVRDWYVKNTGDTYGNIIGKTPREVFPGEAAARIYNEDKEIIESGKPIDGEIEVPFDDGNRIFLVSKFPILDSNGAPRGVCGISTDITDIKRAEEALKKSEARLANAQRIACVGNWEYDIATGKRIWSDETRRICGFESRPQPDYIDFFKHIHPDDWERVKRMTDRALMDHLPFSDDYRIVKPDGSVCFVRSHAEVTAGDDGIPLKISGTLQDITEAKLSEERINRLNRTLWTFYGVNQLILHETDRKRLLDEAVKIILEFGGFKMALIGMADFRTGRVTPVSYAGIEDGYVEKLNIRFDDTPEGSGPSGQALRTGKCVVCRDTETDESFRPWREGARRSGFRSSAAFPIPVAGAVAGVINVYSAEVDDFGMDEVRLLNELAGNIGHALQSIEESEERREAVAELQRSERKFRNLMESLPIGIALVSMDALKGARPGTSANRALLLMFGFDSKEESFKCPPITGYCKAEDRDRLLDLIRKDVCREQDILFSRKDGSLFWGSVTAYVKNAGDLNPHLILVVQDITERKRSEEALRESEERFRRIFEQNRDAQILMDRESLKIIDANPAAVELYGFSRSELMEGGVPLFFGEDYGAFLDEVIGFRECSGGFSVERAGNVKKDGSRIIASIKGQVIRLKECDAMYLTLRDITSLIRIEEESRLMQAKLMHANKMTSLGTLASGVAHEINNPNNFILFNSALLAEAWQDSQKILAEYYAENGDFSLGGLPFTEMREIIPDLLSGISDGSRRIKGIVDGLRDFSRIDKTGMEGEIDVNRVIFASVSILNNQISKYTDNFRVECAENLPPVKGSAQKIEQVAINLVLNALQSLTGRRQSVRVRTSFDSERSQIVIGIKDEGIGMSKELVERITEPFFTTKTDKGGTGLGLSISYSIIKEHGGSLEFSSVPGKGTEAAVRLPAKKTETPSHSGEHSHEPS